METIEVTIQLASGETARLEITGLITLTISGSKEVQFTSSGEVTIKVVGDNRRFTSIQERR